MRIEWYIKNSFKNYEQDELKLTPSQLKLVKRGNNLSKELLFGGYKNFYFCVGVEGINFVNLWYKQNPNANLGNKAYFILNSYSEFYIRTLEQSMISFYKPIINDNRLVNYSFSSIYIRGYKGNTKTKVEAFTEDGSLFNSYHSYQSACDQLGITKSMLEYNLNVLSNYVFSPVANQKLQLISRNKEIKLTARVHKSSLIEEIKGIDLNSLESGYFYLFLQDKKTVIGKFTTMAELIEKTGITRDHLKFRNKEYTLKCDISLLDLSVQPTDSTLKLVVESLANEGKVEVYVVSSPDLTAKFINQQQIQIEGVVSYDLQDQYKVRFHVNSKEAFTELKNIANIEELYKGKKIAFSHFNSYYLSGVGGDIFKKRIFLNRFWLIWEKDYDSSLAPDKLNIPLKAIKNSQRRYRHLMEVVSVDFMENNKIRLHTNTEQAFNDLCELVGLNPSLTINNISNYLLSSTPRPRYKSRFKLYWKDEFDPNNLPK